MINRSFRVSILLTGIVLSGVVTVPAFAQNYGLVPRGACPKISSAATYTSPPQVQQQTAYSVAASTAAPVREAQPRSRKRGFGSPF